MNNAPIRILQINTLDIAGGAEKIAWELFISYHKRNYQSKLIVGTKYSNEPEVYQIFQRDLRNILPDVLKKGRVINFILKKMNTPLTATWLHEYLDGFKGYEDFYYPNTGKILDKFPERPDIIHIHNLHGGYFDLRHLPYLTHQLPTILTLHDAWLLSGHCAHSFTCERWKTGCGNCPDLTIYPAIRRDATAYNWQRKSDIFKSSKFHVVTPSQWLMDKVNQSILKPGIITSKVIPNGVDLTIFHQANQNNARQELGLPKETRILLFTANSIHKNIWKDYKTLQNTLEEIATSETNILCLALGESSPSKHISKGIEIKFVPYLNNPEKVARYYQAADIYVHPTRADTFPLTILEALACGTPVIASNVGGISEQIIVEETGFLTPVGNAQVMADQIIYLLSDDTYRKQLGQQAADDAVKRFGLEMMVDRYIQTYQEIIAAGG